MLGAADRPDAGQIFPQEIIKVRRTALFGKMSIMPIPSDHVQVFISDFAVEEIVLFVLQDLYEAAKLYPMPMLESGETSKGQCHLAITLHVGELLGSLHSS